MRFLADQDVYGTSVRFISGLGHDVVPVAQLGLARASDTELLRVAHDQGRIFVTRDRDFGALVFVQGQGPGVIDLRILPSTQDAVHAELARVLTLYGEQELAVSFVVIEPGRIAFASSARPRRRRVGGAGLLCRGKPTAYAGVGYSFGRSAAGTVAHSGQRWGVARRS
jgi:predicted nuclease of predicted toxin-antitoxin system